MQRDDLDSEPASPVAETWASHASFREAIAQLVRVTPERLAEWFPRGFQETSISVADTDSERSALTAFGFLASTMDAYRDAGAVLAELRGLVATDLADELQAFDRIRPELERLLHRSPEQQRERVVRVAQHAVVPTLLAVSSALDLRVVTRKVDPDDERAFRLVPVPVLRLEFDEAVGAGSALAFQVPNEAIEDLLDELTRINEAVQNSAEALTDWMA